jgi:ABC-type bacteriocin/lantibiotic exporter with double-glycine peptidase domain
MQPVPTLIAIGLGICFYGISHYLSKKVSFKIGKERLFYGTAQNVTINELFNGIKSLITFNAIHRWLKEFDKQNTVFTKLYIKDAI